VSRSIVVLDAEVSKHHHRLEVMIVESADLIFACVGSGVRG